MALSPGTRNIAGIYGIEDKAIIMELVEGEDLADLLARAGPAPTRCSTSAGVGFAPPAWSRCCGCRPVRHLRS